MWTNSLSRSILRTDFPLPGSGSKDEGATSKPAYDTDSYVLLAMACAYHIGHQLLSSHNATEIFELKQHIACLGSALHYAASRPLRCRQNVNSTDEAIGSDEIVAQVTRLLQRRSTKHHVCESRSPAKPSLPARLIEIRPDPFHTDQYVAKLVVPRSSIQQYICLSYRWTPSTLL
jgi:hypothetical protein